MTPSPLDVARSIYNRECPVKGKVDLVVLGTCGASTGCKR